MRVFNIKRRPFMLCVAIITGGLVHTKALLSCHAAGCLALLLLRLDHRGLFEAIRQWSELVMLKLRNGNGAFHFLTHTFLLFFSSLHRFFL